MPYFIFDLDHTVLDSSHRQNTLPDGSLDLAHWMENNTREKVMRDSALPMARTMRALYSLGTIVVCTARCFRAHDLELLERHNLKHHAYLSRGAYNDNRGDAQLKVELLTGYFAAQGFANVADARALMWDDNAKVIEAMRGIGIDCRCAIRANTEMHKRNIRNAVKRINVA